MFSAPGRKCNGIQLSLHSHWNKQNIMKLTGMHWFPIVSQDTMAFQGNQPASKPASTVHCTVQCTVQNSILYCTVYTSATCVFLCFSVPIYQHNSCGCSHVRDNRYYCIHVYMYTCIHVYCTIIYHSSWYKDVICKLIQNEVHVIVFIDGITGCFYICNIIFDKSDQ